ncbi:hypothetical protein HMPREF9700_00278 [Bergeyella zoohelcum CCUG 30536]|uniref:Uncharacterized protein n=1 Tax=Bergeyella zoohelcum TaxID=1015 RepID=A0A376BZR8_9FLAO|nr:hypothetical protein HMPREF9700_00278 [Bergeyella zoohelcum CCUG 30536]SSZ47126.1 Uncharacterised protein [Bergeyella zoohelcum]
MEKKYDFITPAPCGDFFCIFTPKRKIFSYERDRPSLQRGSAENTRLWRKYLRSNVSANSGSRKLPASKNETYRFRTDRKTRKGLNAKNIKQAQKEPWTRSDKIAFAALFASIISIIITLLFNLL